MHMLWVSDPRIHSRLEEIFSHFVGHLRGNVQRRDRCRRTPHRAPLHLAAQVKVRPAQVRDPRVRVVVVVVLR